MLGMVKARLSTAQVVGNLLRYELPAVAPVISRHGSHAEAAVACIVRIHTSEPIQQISTYNYDISVLFIKRAIKSNDTWSGHIAFPGGHLNKGEDDYTCAIRETMEEIGLDLRESDYCKWLGRLPQKSFQKRRRKLVILPHAFLIASTDTSLKLCPDEVADVRWINLSHILSRGNDELDVIDKNLVDLLRLRGVWNNRISALCRMMNTEVIFFPALNLNIEYDCDHKRCDTCPADTSWLLWGMTFGILHDFLTHCNNGTRYFHSTIPFWFSNRVVNMCIWCWSSILQGSGSRNLFMSLVMGSVAIVYIAPITLVLWYTVKAIVI